MVCGMFAWGSAAYAEQLVDDLQAPQTLNTGEMVAGNFTTGGTLISNDSIRGATLVLTLSDDGEPGTLLNTTTGTTYNTQTYNGARTATRIVTTNESYTDGEAEAAQVIIGDQVEDVAINSGSYSYLAGQTIDGPTPVPVDECFVTAGYYTSCQNVVQADTRHSLSGATGEATVRIDITGSALLDFKTTGTLSYSVAATVGDMVVQNAVLEVNQVAGSLALSYYVPTQLNGMFQADGLNNAGQVVGQMTDTADGWPHAALWNNGTVTDLGMNGCRETVSQCWSRANAINDQGQMVGESHTSDSWPSQYFGPWSIYYAHEAFWEDAATPLVFMRTVGWEYGRALDINARSHAVGHGRSVDWTRVAGDYVVHGYFWRNNDEVVEFGEYNQGSKAFALNDNDQVVGEIDVAGATQAFLWDDGAMTILGDFGGGYSTAVGINNAGQVVGSATNAAGQSRAFLWQDGVMYPLEARGDTVYSRALAINNAGIIVGEMDGRAVAWQDGRLVEINDLVDPGLGLNFIKATAINDLDQIIATTGGAYGNQLLSALLPPEGDVSVCATGCDAATLQEGIDMAPVEGVIVAWPGIYNETITLDSGKTLVSWLGADKTIIDAQGAGTVARLSASSTLDGFTVTGGSSASGAGVIANSSTVLNSIITDNHSSGSIGGIVLVSSTLRDSTVSNNSAVTYGGGITTAGSSSVVEGNTITGNTATDGAGLAVYGSNDTVTRNRFIANMASGKGGGLFVPYYKYGSAINSVFSGNSARYGGGLYVDSYAGLYCTNCTIYGNTATSGYGSGMYGGYYGRGFGINNSIVWGNNGRQVQLPSYASWYNSYSIVEGGLSGTNILNVDPQFADAANGDFHLSAGSPAIDSGYSAYGTVTTDIEGTARPVDGDGLGAGGTGDGSDLDMGAYEYH